MRRFFLIISAGLLAGALLGGCQGRAEAPAAPVATAAPAAAAPVDTQPPRGAAFPPATQSAQLPEGGREARPTRRSATRVAPPPAAPPVPGAQVGAPVANILAPAPAAAHPGGPGVEPQDARDALHRRPRPCGGCSSPW